MLILAGVTIAVVINGGLFKQAEEAVAETDKAGAKEVLQMELMAEIMENKDNIAGIDIPGALSRAEVTASEIPQVVGDEIVLTGITYTTKNGNTFVFDENMSIITIVSGNSGGNTTTPDIPEVDEQEVVPRRRLCIKCRSSGNSMVRCRK